MFEIVDTNLSHEFVVTITEFSHERCPKTHFMLIILYANNLQHYELFYKGFKQIFLKLDVLIEILEQSTR